MGAILILLAVGSLIGTWILAGTVPTMIYYGLKILYQIANGMAAAHEQAVVHRDLKPSNILIGKSGLLKIVDFGIASVDRSAESTLTNAGAIVGSPAYLAPERVSQETADERSEEDQVEEESRRQEARRSASAVEGPLQTPPGPGHPGEQE